MKSFKPVMMIAAAALVASVICSCSTNYGDNRPKRDDYSSSSVSSKLATHEYPAGSYTVGGFDGSVYSSDYLGFRYKLPDGYQAVSVEEAPQLINLGVSSEDITYEMAAKLSTGDNIVIFTEKLREGEAIEKYMERFKKRFYEQNPRSFCLINDKGVELAGKGFCYIDMAQIIDIEHGEYNQFWFYFRRYAERICAICMTCETPTARDTMLEGLLKE